MVFDLVCMSMIGLLVKCMLSVLLCLSLCDYVSGY